MMIEKLLSQEMRAHTEILNTEFLVRGQGVSVNDDREASCHRLHCEMSDPIKGQLTN
jgi:hypothetical protein